MDQRFRNVHRYAGAHGFLSGFSTMEEGIDPDGLLHYEGVLVPATHAEYRPNVKREDLNGSPTIGDIGAMFRAAHRYADGYGFATGFPSFEQGKDVDGDTVYGITILKNSLVTVMSVPATDLGNPNFGDAKEMVIAAHRYARSPAIGGISGFPLFEQGLQGGVLHYGVAIINANVQFRRIQADALGIFSKFTFDPSVTQDQRNTILERHCFVLERIGACASLDATERNKLRGAYRKNIIHGSSTDPTQGQRALIGRSGGL